MTNTPSTCGSASALLTLLVLLGAAGACEPVPPPLAALPGSDVVAADVPLTPVGPAPCLVFEDCLVEGVCPPAAPLGCTCVPIPGQGPRCVPVCQTSADCPLAEVPVLCGPGGVCVRAPAVGETDVVEPTPQDVVGPPRPTPCAVPADCAAPGACPVEAVQGCACVPTPAGRGCVPTCTRPRDCPHPAGVPPVCSPQGLCTE